MPPLTGRLAACILAGSLLLLAAAAARTLPASQQPQDAAGGMDAQTVFGNMGLGRSSASSAPAPAAAPAVVTAKRTAAGASSQTAPAPATGTVRQAGAGSGGSSADYGSGTSYGTPTGYYFSGVPPNPPGSYYYSTSGLNFEYDYTYLPLTDRVVFAQKADGLFGVNVGTETITEADPVFAATGATAKAIIDDYYADDKSDYDSLKSGASIGPLAHAIAAADGKVYGVVGAKGAARAEGSTKASFTKDTVGSNTVTAGVKTNLNAGASGVATINRRDVGNPRTTTVPQLTGLAGYLG